MKLTFEVIAKTHPYHNVEIEVDSKDGKRTFSFKRKTYEKVEDLFSNVFKIFAHL